MRTDRHSQKGLFYYHNFIMEIYNCNYRQKTLIEESLFEAASAEKINIAINIKSIIIHEMTHFSDVTSTLWGAEYIYRKNHFIDSLRKGFIADTFMLNESEIALHSTETKIHFPHKIIKESKINFSVEHTEKFGPILYIHFPQEGSLKLSVPVSMLSLLEANATANELLSIISSNKKLPKEKQITTLQNFETTSSGIMSDPDLSEYNILIIISEKFFPFLQKENLLKYVACLCRVCLNFDAFALSKLAIVPEIICPKNKPAATALAWDLRRGQNRASLFFFISSIIRGDFERGLINQADIENGLNTSPYKFIRNYLDSRLKISEDDKMEKIEINEILELLSKKDKFNDLKILNETIKNYEKLNENPLSTCNLSKIKIIDFFLDDGSIASPPNRINIDIEQRFYETSDLSNEIDQHYKKFEIRKNHLPLDHLFIQKNL
ncbi:hypothetical protein [Vreelandella venusta]|uniref:Uncharacterized protein n=1 Tax=Vreelandella venusta TaxID=44935 RepID=A0ABX2B6Q7_9GAMM|nr:hypothetical protein [Halomonas venusta]AZM95286.1 hypothetical protein EI420_06105 [Halomonas venusta]NPT29802.1 hypothetical protein [Halomonas venusta]